MHTDLLDTVLVSQKDAKPARDHPGAPGASTAAMKDSSTSPADGVCPVDHKTREAWLQQARAAPAATPQPGQPAQPVQSIQETKPTAATQTSSWSSWLRLPFSGQNAPPHDDSTTSPSKRAAPPSKILDEAREISSIPRAATPGGPTPEARPSNHELETGASADGKWIYPSEKMFFEAMKRKGYNSASAADMKTVVPIHNAVNERAWAEILKWEAPYVAPAAACGGPRLHSFAGLSESMTPKARINTLLGYTAPFDRHDWVVDRCGVQVDYVIDFYAGRNDGSGNGKLNFYLDVRPKLNSWEGVKMRAMRATGLA